MLKDPNNNTLLFRTPSFREASILIHLSLNVVELECENSLWICPTRDDGLIVEREERFRSDEIAIDGFRNTKGCLDLTPEVSAVLPVS